MSKFQITESIRKINNLRLSISQFSTSNQTIFPCYLGIIFFDDYNINLFKKLEFQLNFVFDSFFYGISNIECMRTLKKEYRSDLIHPTNYFYKIIKEEQNESNFNIGLGLTNLPLYSSYDKDLLYLFGEAHLDHNCAIVSSYNLRGNINESNENNEILNLRIIKEIIHEIGHLLLGSNHCLNKLCVMRFSKYIQDIEKKSLNFCIDCKQKLIKLRTEHNF